MNKNIRGGYCLVYKFSFLIQEKTVYVILDGCQESCVLICHSEGV